MSKRILLVDDEADLLTLVQARLAANGYEVITAHNGLEGLEKASKEKPNLILLDVMMPRKDGFEVLRELKSNIETTSIPVVMLTAKGESQSFSKAKDLGAIDYITKPFNAEALLDLVKRYLA